MDPAPTITQAVARIVPTAGDAAPRRYRPLVAGPALLRRPAGAPAWSIDIECDQSLRPRAEPLSRLLARLAWPRPGAGVTWRLGVAVAGPLDVPPPTVVRRFGPPPAPPSRVRIDIYGWALMYQPPGMRGRALVDADDRFADLPAVFELPLELLDRAEFLESRGFRTRPLVIPTRPEDFTPGPDGRLRNRFFPEAAIRPPSWFDQRL